MKRVVRLLTTSMALLLLLSAISFAFTDAPAQAADETSRVRVAHLSPDAPAVDIYANGAKVLSGVPYKTISDYLTVPAGSYRFEVRAANAPASSKPLLKLNAQLRAKQDYTVAALNFLSDIGLKLYRDNNLAPLFGQAKIKVVHASPDAPAVDIAVKNGPALIENLSFTQASDTLGVATGTYDLEVRVAGTNTVALALPGVKLEAGKVYTVFAINPVASLGVAVTAVPGVNDPRQTSRIRVAHLSPDAPKVDVYVNDTVALTNVPFKTVSNYLTVPSGTYNFKVRVAGTPATSQPVINVDGDINPGKDYTVAAINFVSQIEGKIFVDNNRAPAEGKAKLTVIHASPDAPRVDVNLKDGRILIPDLDFGNQSRTLSLKAGSYDLEVRASEDKDILALSLPGVKLEAGKVYTVFAVDRLANLGVVVTAVPGI